MENFSKEWREARLGMGLSQKDLSKVLGIGQGYISDIERGRRNPSEHLQKLLHLTIKSYSAIISPSQENSNTTTKTKTDEEEEEHMNLRLQKLEAELLGLYRENKMLKETLEHYEKKARTRNKAVNED